MSLSKQGHWTWHPHSSSTSCTHCPSLLTHLHPLSLPPHIHALTSSHSWQILDWLVPSPLSSAMTARTPSTQPWRTMLPHAGTVPQRSCWGPSATPRVWTCGLWGVSWQRWLQVRIWVISASAQSNCAASCPLILLFPSLPILLPPSSHSPSSSPLLPPPLPIFSPLLPPISSSSHLSSPSSLLPLWHTSGQAATWSRASSPPSGLSLLVETLMLKSASCTHVQSNVYTHVTSMAIYGEPCK